VQPIFDLRCAACHGEQPQGGLKLDTQRHVLEGGQSGAAVVPGYPDRSLLLAKVVSGQMPMGGEKLPESEIDAIRQWIDEAGRSEAVTAELRTTESHVLPIYQMRCQVCHGKRKQEGGLDLRTMASRLKGGESGPALVPGKPEESLLLQRIERGEMPPPDMLFENHVKTPTDAEVALLRKWIAEGALPSENDEPVADRPLSAEELSHWAFQTPVWPEPPEVQNAARVRNPIDAFILQELEAKGLVLSPEASPRALLRRAYLDLTGMPPTLEQIRAFADDSGPGAYERLVDQLLDSQEYGERWAQIWLDLAGYADSEGVIDEDRLRLHAWRYRDYVIRALNSDKPYDRFLIEQLAGDEIIDYASLESVTQEHVDTLAATGFLRMTPDGTYGSATGSIAERFTVVADEIEVLSSAVMGVTVGCARCHDHKYDPFSQREYYSLGAVFQSALDPYDWLDPTERFLEVGLASEQEAAAAANAPLEAEIEQLQAEFDALVTPFFERELERRLTELPADLREGLREVANTPRKMRTAAQKRLAGEHRDLLQIPNADGEWHQIAEAFPELKDTAGPVNTKIKELKDQLIPTPKIRAVFDMGGEPSRTYLLQRGDAQAIGERVSPAVPRMLAARTAPLNPAPTRAGTSGNRLAFARWLTDPEHPLTSRVMVNRIWLGHFGRGIVSTPSNFGLTGATPSHPELLDWLALEFIRQDWSPKAMHRLIMTSTTYRQSSKVTPLNERLDPENLRLSRMPLRRMEAEVLRDTLFLISHRLDQTPGGLPDPVLQRKDGLATAVPTPRGWRRSMYITQQTSHRMGASNPTILDTFDFPEMTPNCLERVESTVVPQALHLLNDPTVRELADSLAERVRREAGSDTDRRIQQAYWIVLNRPPTSEEQSVGRQALEKLQKSVENAGEKKAAERALAKFCHTLLNSAGFLYID
jgi:mono/diheme cytochrome c family protein